MCGVGEQERGSFLVFGKRRESREGGNWGVGDMHPPEGEATSKVYCQLATGTHRLLLEQDFIPFGRDSGEKSNPTQNPSAVGFISVKNRFLHSVQDKWCLTGQVTCKQKETPFCLTSNNICCTSSERLRTERPFICTTFTTGSLNLPKGCSPNQESPAPPLLPPRTPTPACK